ncbi:MAG: hypothetical protein E7520_05745 [Ruminococcaceae bacterium]|nr:hypothetical protein [Oscillospiraceae bacterium]
MLGKLIKYDLLKYKYFMLFMLSAPVAALITKFTNSIPDKSAAIVIIDKFMSGITIGLSIGLLINLFMRILVNFEKSLYLDESYLTHTLPVKRGTVYSSKALSSSLLITVSYAVCVMSLCIVDSESYAAMGYRAMLLALLEIICIVMTAFLGIILGNRENSKKKGFSILFSVIIYFIEQIPLVAIIFIAFGNIIFTVNDDAIPQKLKNYMLVFAAVYAVYIAVLFVLGRKSLEKGVNVD